MTVAVTGPKKPAATSTVAVKATSCVALAAKVPMVHVCWLEPPKVRPLERVAVRVTVVATVLPLRTVAV